MNPSTRNDSFTSANVSTGEETLRLIANLPAPDGLEGRIKTSLEGTQRDGRVLFWPSARTGGEGWMRGSTVRAAAAAAIVFVVVGGGWGVYSHVQPATQSNVIVMPPRVNAGGGFSSAGAMRTPQTVDGPVVTHQVTEAPAKARVGSNGATVKKSHRAKAVHSKEPALQSAAR